MDDESEPLWARWVSYAGTEERVLRAVASGTESLMAADTLQRFGLASSAAASKVAKLVGEGVLVQEGPGNCRSDHPFQKGWVIPHSLPDAGIHFLRPIPWTSDSHTPISEAAGGLTGDATRR